MFLRAIRLLAAVLAAVAANAQPFGGPIEGYTFDRPTSSIRAIVGRPGSARLAEAIVDQVEFASVAPGRPYALAVREQRFLFLNDLPQENPVDLGDAPSVPDGLVWSGDAKLAVAFSRHEAWIQVIRGLPGAPSAGERVPIAGAIQNIAVDARGENIVIVREGDGHALLRFDGDLLPQAIPAIDHPGPIAFSREPGVLLVTEADRQSVLTLHLNAQTVTPAFQAEAPIAAIHLLDAPDRSPLLAVLTEQRLAHLYDPRTWECVQTFELDLDPSSLSGIGPKSLALGERASPDEPLWILNASGVSFVPATPLDDREASGP
jgi:hypothetical protein